MYLGTQIKSEDIFLRYLSKANMLFLFTLSLSGLLFVWAEIAIASVCLVLFASYVNSRKWYHSLFNGIFLGLAFGVFEHMIFHHDIAPANLILTSVLLHGAFGILISPFMKIEMSYRKKYHH